jgi:hypothetical protein
MKQRARLASGALSAAVLTLLLSACGSPPDRVSGLRDDVRHITRLSKTDSRPRTVNECKPRTRQKKHSSTSTSHGRKTKRTWYTTETYQDCQKVRHGTEHFSHVVRAEGWCVELDDVGGDSAKDDIWYRVSHSTYEEAVKVREGGQLTFKPLKRDC